MNSISKLKVMIDSKKVGTLTMAPGSRVCAFEYDKQWLSTGFSISPLELPLKQEVFIAKESPFWGNFGIIVQQAITENTQLLSTITATPPQPT